MNCPKCLSNSAYTGTFTYVDDLGVVSEIFCYCTKCKEDITERITDEWIKSCAEKSDRGTRGRDRRPEDKGQSPRGQSG